MFTSHVCSMCFISVPGFADVCNFFYNFFLKIKNKFIYVCWYEWKWDCLWCWITHATTILIILFHRHNLILIYVEISMQFYDGWSHLIKRFTQALGTPRCFIYFINRTFQPMQGACLWLNVIFDFFTIFCIYKRNL